MNSNQALDLFLPEIREGMGQVDPADVQVPKISSWEELPHQHGNNTYNPAIFARVLSGMANGRPGLRVCKELGVYWSTFYDWVELTEDNSRAYSWARARQAHSLVQDTVHSAYKLARLEKFAPKDAITGEINHRLASAWVNALDRSARLNLEVAKRLLPEVYGDRIEVEHRGGQEIYVISFNPEAKKGPRESLDSQISGVIDAHQDATGTFTVDQVRNAYVKDKATKKNKAVPTSKVGGTQDSESRVPKAKGKSRGKPKSKTGPIPK